jgi:hypothetical protein
MPTTRPLRDHPALIAIVVTVVTFGLRLPFLGTSPLSHDSALLLVGVREMLVNGVPLPFAEMVFYRPVTPLLIWSGAKALALTPTPEHLLLLGNVLCAACSALTAGALAWWFRRVMEWSAVLATSAALAWACLPVVASFAGETVNAVPALLLATLAYLCADLAARAGTAPRTQAALACGVGPLLLLALLTREDSLLALPACALRLLLAGGRGPAVRRVPRGVTLLLLALAGGAVTGGLWFLAELTLLHPGADYSIWFESKVAGVNVIPSQLLSLEHWGLLLQVVSHGVGPLVLFGLLVACAAVRRAGRWDPARLALAAWLLASLCLLVQHFVTALRFQVVLSVPAALLAAQALAEVERERTRVALAIGTAALAFTLSYPSLAATSRLPHAHALRAYTLARHAGPADIVIPFAQDYAYLKWWMPERAIVPLWSILPPSRQAELWSSDQGHDALRATDTARPLIQELAVVAGKMAGTGGRVLVIPPARLTQAVMDLASGQCVVEVIETIPPGRSRSQDDPFAWKVGLGPVASVDQEVLLAITAR